MSEGSCILAADDEERDLLLLQMAFERAGFSERLLLAQNGREAIDYLQGKPFPDGTRLHGKPQLMLLDVKMPFMSGFDVLEWPSQRAEFRDLPVVMLSSSSNDKDISRARALGAREYFVKPVGIHELTELLREVKAKYVDIPPTG